MTFSATFEVRGLPKPQPRPRAFAKKVGKKILVRAYDKGTAEAWKQDVVTAGRQHRPTEPLNGSVSVRVKFLMPRPKRLMRKKDDDGPIWATGKPDVDNLAKAVLDAMTLDGWWGDDAQVVDLRVSKCYHAKAGVPGANVSVRMLAQRGEVA